MGGLLAHVVERVAFQGEQFKLSGGAGKVEGLEDLKEIVHFVVREIHNLQMWPYLPFLILNRNQTTDKIMCQVPFLQGSQHEQSSCLSDHIVAKVNELQIQAIFDPLYLLNEVMAHVKDKQLLGLQGVEDEHAAEQVLAEIDAS